MHHFFVSKEEIGEEKILLRGENFHHLHKVLRGQIGEKILISDGEGVDYQCEIQSFSEDEASLSICFREEPHEMPFFPSLFWKRPKNLEAKLFFCRRFPREKRWSLSSKRRWSLGFPP